MAAKPTSPRQFGPYAVAIGHVVIAWNRLHEELGLLFAAVRCAKKPDLGDSDRLDALVTEWKLMGAVWSSSLYDRPKRSMLLAIVNNSEMIDALRRFPKAFADLKWLLSEVEKLEDFRNNAVHLPLRMGGRIGQKLTTENLWQELTSVNPDVHMQNRRALRLAAKTGPDILREFRWTRLCCIHLSRFAHHMVPALVFDAKWPDRPSLPMRP
jgi:hypothetical protein